MSARNTTVARPAQPVRWQVHRPATVSAHGLVACQNWLAAEAGAAVLARGHNAVDAAVTTLLTLSVVEPWLSGVGGGGFLLRADGTTGAVDALDFSMAAPAALDPGRYPLVGGSDDDWFNWPAVKDGRNLVGPDSVCVPGAVAGMAAALDRFGTIGFADALAPAIAQAEAGLAVDWFNLLQLGMDAATLARYPASAALFLPNGTLPTLTSVAEGGPIRLPMTQKRRSLEILAEHGPRAFYQGPLAEGIVEDLRAAGSVLTLQDFADYRAQWLDTKALPYGGMTIHAAAGLNGGPSLIQALDRLRALMPGIDRSTVPGADAAHAYAAVIRETYEHRLTTMGHAAGPDTGGADCTTHVSVVDRHGTMVAVTNTLLSRFGSKFASASGGFLLNNGMMWFDPRPGQPNSIAAGRRPLTNMTPVIGLRDGKPALAIGAAGGRKIFPAVLQVLSHHLDFGMDLEAAFHQPRLDASQPVVLVDAAADAAIAPHLSRDFPVRVTENTVYPVMFAIPSAVARDPATGLNTGMTHPMFPAAGVAEGTRPPVAGTTTGR